MEKEINKEKPKEPAFTKASEDKEKKEESLEETKKKLEECQKLKNEYLVGWQRARADLLNYKKEELERLGEILKYADVGVILKILPILDNFETAARQNFPLENLSGQEKERINQAIQGFLQIKKQLQEFLKSQGVEEIKSVGEKFDPNLHEVVEGVEPAVASASAKVTADKKTTAGKEIESGVIIEEIQKGYKINGRLLRPAKVKVMK